MSAESSTLKTGKMPDAATMPIYALEGRPVHWAVSTDFRRLNDTRPGYGYVGIPDPNQNVLEPDDVGVWKMDLQSGKSELIYSVAQAAAVPNPHNDTDGLKHYFNHLLVSTDGSQLSADPRRTQTDPAAGAACTPGAVLARSRGPRQAGRRASRDRNPL